MILYYTAELVLQHKGVGSTYLLPHVGSNDNKNNHNISNYNSSNNNGDRIKSYN